MLEGPESRPDAFELRLTLEAIRAPCLEAGFELVVAVWSEPADWTSYAAVVVGAPWDYTEHPARFLEVLGEIEAAGVPLLNPLATLRWNLDKRYLRELEAAGLPTVPTHWAARVDAAAVEAAFEAFGRAGREVTELVIKPQIGAGAWRQVRLRRGEELPAPELLPPGEALLQPFLAEVQERGELSLVYFGRTFSHALRKLPRPGDYRVQSMYGAREEVYEPCAEELALAEAVLAKAPGDLLYARVDFLWDTPAEGEASLRLIELELIEPYLYPEQGPAMGATFARALQRALA